MAIQRDLELRSLIGQNLAKARQLAGMSQDEVMLKLFGTNKELTGRTANRISEWEHGVHLPDAELLCVLARMYSVSTDYILGLSVEPEIDETAGRAGLLYNGLTEVLSSSVQDMAAKLTMAAAVYMQSLPKAPQLHLLDLCKKLGTEFIANRDSSMPAELRAAIMEMLPVVREIDKLQAVQFGKFAMAVEEITDTDAVDTMVAKLYQKGLTRYPAAVLPTEVREELQLGLLPTGAEE